MNSFGKIAWKLLLDCIHCLVGSLGNLCQGLAREGARQAGGFRSLHEVSAFDFLDLIMPVV